MEDVPEEKLTFQTHLIGLFTKAASLTALCITRLDAQLQLQLYELIRLQFLILSYKFSQEKGFSLCLPTVFLTSYLVSHRMLPYAFARLKRHKIIIDPLFQDKLSPHFSNQVLSTVFHNKQASKTKCILPASWNQENLCQLRPNDLLFHYTVNSLKPLLRLQDDKKEYKAFLNRLQELSSVAWKAHSFYLFKFVNNPEETDKIFKLFLNQADIIRLINIFCCLHQTTLILAQASLLPELLSSLIKQSQTLAKILKIQVNEDPTESNLIMNHFLSYQPNFFIFSFNNPMGLYQSLPLISKYDRQLNKLDTKVHTFLAQSLLKFEFFQLIGLQDLLKGIVYNPYKKLDKLNLHFEQSYYHDFIQQWATIQQDTEFPGQYFLALKKKYKAEMSQSFESAQNMDQRLDKFLISKRKSEACLRHFSTKNKYGVRSFPIFKEMRPVASAITSKFLNTVFSHKNIVSPLISSHLMVYWAKLYSMGIEGRYMCKMPPDIDQIKEMQEQCDSYIGNDIEYGDFKENIKKKLAAFMKDRNAQDFIKDEASDTSEESKSEESQIKQCWLCSSPCAPEDVNPFGIACLFSSINLISKAQIQQVSPSLLDFSQNKQEWEKALHRGQFFLKPSSIVVHYDCIQNSNIQDLRVFEVEGCIFNCVIPMPSETPLPVNYLQFSDPQKIYQDPHPSIQFVATLIETYNSIHHSNLEEQISKEYALPITVRNSLPRLPMIIAQIIADNVALAVRFIGLLSFLEECQANISPTLACIDNMKSVFNYFASSHLNYLDEVICEPTPPSFLRYGHKIERFVADILLWKDQFDEEAKLRIKQVFSMYAHLLIEMKGYQGHSLEISRAELLPQLEMTSALILSRYKMQSLSSVINQLKNLEGTKLFDYLWEEVLEMSPLMLGVFTNKAVMSSQACSIISTREIYFESKPLRAMLLSPYRLKFNLIPLPKSFIELQAQYLIKKCEKCGTTPDQPVVCCMCGAVVCLSSCCNVMNYNECLQHAYTCGYGTGLFLRVNLGTVFLILGACRYYYFDLPTPYLSDLAQPPTQKIKSCILYEKVVSEIEKRLNALEAHID